MCLFFDFFDAPPLRTLVPQDRLAGRSLVGDIDDDGVISTNVPFAPPPSVSLQLH